MNTLRIKAVVSFILLVLFVIVFVSGIVLYLAPSGSIAHKTNWHFLIFDKWQWKKIHTVSAFIMSVVIFVHLFLNRKIFIAEIKSVKNYFIKYLKK